MNMINLKLPVRSYAFSVPHDAGDPVGFVIRFGSKKNRMATDMVMLRKILRILLELVKFYSCV